VIAPTPHGSTVTNFSGRTRPCSKCHEERPLEGGVDRGNGKWHCGRCWRGFAMRPKRKK
jgi:hypothetical protein